jgi:hypothetical protein
MFTGFTSLVRVACGRKMAGLAASHVIENGAIALSPWAVRLAGPIPTALSIIAPPLVKKYVIPYTISTIIPAVTKKGSVTRLLWTVITGR